MPIIFYCSADVAIEELGGDYFDKRDRQGVERRLVRRLEGLGYKVSLDRSQPDRATKLYFHARLERF